LTETSIQLIYLLFSFYKEVYIYKPKTSRPTNSEKYIICKYFDITEEQRNIVLNKLTNLSEKIKNNKSKFVSFTLFGNIETHFIEQIYKINGSLLENQCQHLENAISLCTDKNFLDNYENKFEESFQTRREIFHNWEELYNLNSYV
jgi:cap1 methyltransferase